MKPNPSSQKEAAVNEAGQNSRYQIAWSSSTVTWQVIMTASSNKQNRLRRCGWFDLDERYGNPRFVQYYSKQEYFFCWLEGLYFNACLLKIFNPALITFLAYYERYISGILWAREASHCLDIRCRSSESEHWVVTACQGKGHYPNNWYIFWILWNLTVTSTLQLYLSIHWKKLSILTWKMASYVCERVCTSQHSWKSKACSGNCTTNRLPLTRRTTKILQLSIWLWMKCHRRGPLNRRSVPGLPDYIG